MKMLLFLIFEDSKVFEDSRFENSFDSTFAENIVHAELQIIILFVKL